MAVRKVSWDFAFCGRIEKKHLETTKLWVNLFLCGTHCAIVFFLLPVIVRSTDQTIFKNEHWPHSKLPRWHLPGSRRLTIALFSSWIFPSVSENHACHVSLTSEADMFSTGEPGEPPPQRCAVACLASVRVGLWGHEKDAHVACSRSTVSEFHGNPNCTLHHWYSTRNIRLFCASFKYVD